jgi:hypothetical protein
MDVDVAEPRIGVLELEQGGVPRLAVAAPGFDRDPLQQQVGPRARRRSEREASVALR